LKKRNFALMAILVAFLALGVFSPRIVQSSHLNEAATPTPTPSIHKRISHFTVETQLYEWWMVRWKNNRYVCNIKIEHEGLPRGSEIYDSCGAERYEDWYDTPPCEQAKNGGDVSQCSGVYLLYDGEGTGSKEVDVELPLPNVWLSLKGCEYTPPTYTCSSQPYLVLEGNEPLPNETIITINGYLDGEPFSCAGSVCELPLQPTGEQGIDVEFWADSSFGDSSETYTSLVRALPQGDFSDPEGDGMDDQLWLADVLSSQWVGERPASCSDIWQVFPDATGLPTWLQTPYNSADLQSSVSYYYLAARLINQGMVDVSKCPDGGLTRSGVASECGVQASRTKLDEWQNDFNNDILTVSNKTGVPAQLLKNLFSRESQFWPGIFTTYMEAGLGQMSEYGADTLLLWNEGFYNQFCPLVLSQDTCDKGFAQLSEEAQNLLRGALVQTVDASCATCAMGIDLSQANFSVEVFANTLVANCQQVNQLIYNITQEDTRTLAGYEDLWRFTLVNYNAGAGCLAGALEKTYDDDDPLDWQHVKISLEEECPGTSDYVEDITIFPVPAPTPTPWVQPSVTSP